MAKRTLEEPEAAVLAADLHADNSTSSKKRKVKHEKSNGAQQPPQELSKAERKALKKLKKQNEEAGNGHIPLESTDASKDTTSAEELPSLDAEAERAAAKAARKAEKKRVKALKNGETDNESTEAIDGTNSEVDAAKLAKKAAKAAKKAKKEARKAAVATGAEADSTTDKVPAANGEGVAVDIEKRLSKQERKAEKKRQKELQKAQATGTGTPEVKSNRHTNGFAVNTTTNGDYKEDSSLQSVPQAEVDKFLSSNFISITDPTTTDTLRPIISFSQLPKDAHPQSSPFTKFKSPTPIQAASWPFLLKGRDVVGVAETGSGKTLAFGVPCIRHIASLPKAKGGAARAVIVSPTRELAVQIHEQIIMIAKPAGLQAVCVYGGVPKESQRAELKTAHIVVATPGRLNDLVEEGSAQLGNVNYLVLDEADRMLDKGFEDAIRKIVSATSPKSLQPSSTTRQTLMFTATWPPSIRELAATFMRNPVKIAIGDNPTGELRANTRIEQKVEVVDPRGKEQRLLQLLKQYQSGASKNDRILVFCLYKKEATRVEGFLARQGLRVAGIHGDLSQEKRAASLESFKAGKTPLLVATDVAARGLDIPAVKVVINCTFPLTVEDYVHRIGRTGRAGADGLAITLFTEHDKSHSGALINVLKAAGQPVPDDLMKFGTTVKKKAHDAYGAFYKDNTDGKEATKIKFDD